MKQLIQMQQTRPMELHDGVMSTTTDVWAVLIAAKDGDLPKIEELVAKCPPLLWCQYDYTTPMQFAVREGHHDAVRYLVENGALDKGDRNHPFLEPIVKLAKDRGFMDIAEYLMESLDDASLVHERGDCGRIDHGYTEDEKRFQEFVDKGNLVEARAMLANDASLALNELAFWGEGIMATAANGADRPMLELLIENGATVPKLSKWGARYYFKHIEIGRFLLENGMDPDHMNWREFTLLHDMAFTGEVEKAKLLIDFGADINAVDEEYKTTPLGYSRHFARSEMEALLRDNGAEDV